MAIDVLIHQIKTFTLQFPGSRAVNTIYYPKDFDDVPHAIPRKIEHLEDWLKDKNFYVWKEMDTKRDEEGMYDLRFYIRFENEKDAFEFGLRL